MRLWGLGVAMLCIAGTALAGEAVEAKFDGQRTVVFRFSESMQTLDLQTGAVLATFSPKLDVTQCDWGSDTTLRCDLGKDAPRATRFRATLSPKLRTTAGAALPATPVVFESVRPEFDVNTNYGDNGLSVDLHVWKSAAADLPRVLRLRIDGKPAPVRLEKRNDWGEDVMLRMTVPEVARESILELSVVPGLASTEGPLRGQQDQRLLRAVIGEPLQVRGATCAGERRPIAAPMQDGRIDLAGCMPGEDMHVLFSRPMQRDAIDAWIRSWPAGVRRSAEWPRLHSAQKDEQRDALRAPSWPFGLVIAAPRDTRTLVIPAMPDANGKASTSPVTLQVSTGLSRPALDAPFFDALLLRGGDPGLQAINAPPLQLNVFAFGRDATRGPMQSPQAGETATPVVAPLLREALAEGGYASIQPDKLWGNPDGGVLRASAPDFDVRAEVSTRVVIAWANAWDGNTPIDDARATLWFADGQGAPPRELANARTNADGVALLHLPDDFVAPERESGKPAAKWFVRIERGSGRKAQRAVLPLETQWRFDLGNAPDILGHGVADRPIYRAGDPVRWTMWLRELRDGRYRAPGAPVTRTLQLQGDRLQPMLTWKQTFDAQGIATGEMRIPIHTRDGDYCIVDSESPDTRVWFHVGTFRAQDLWARATARQAHVDRGQTLTLDVESGFYSGGVGAGIALDEMEAYIEPETPASVFPAWRDYTFAEADTGAELELAGAARTDAQGKATLTVQVTPEEGPEELPFGTLVATAQVRPDDREGTYTNAVKLRYSAFPAHVGIKFDQVFDDIAPVSLTGVVIDADGNALPGRKIEVEVTHTPFNAKQETVVHHCTLVAGASTDCTFPRTKEGTYTFRARSGDAAPTTTERRIWTRWSADTKTEAPELEVEQLGDAVAGKPLRVQVRSAAVPARALVLLNRGRELLTQRVVRLDSPMQIVEIDVPADAPHYMDLVVVARPDNATPRAMPAGFRAPVDYDTDAIEIELVEPTVAHPVSLTFERPQAAPADIARLVVRNDSTQARGVTLTVTDDALRALGKQWLMRMDPANSFFRWQNDYMSMSSASFEKWNGEKLRWVLMRRPGDKCRDCVSAISGQRAMNPIDVSSVESTTIPGLEVGPAVPLARDTTSVALLAPGTVREATSLDQVQVVGAGAIDPNAYDEDVTPDLVTALSERERGTKAGTQTGFARIRERFVDTALWDGHFTLAPGESRTIEFELPDNLTRWRAVAWSHDDGEDFTMAEATIEAGLPLEARLQTPVRIYPGDTTRLAVNVRQTAAHASNAEVRIAVEGDGHPKSVHAATLALPANGQASDGASLEAKTVGTLRVIAAAVTPEGGDAAAAPIEVASTTIPGTRVQAGWIDATPVSLALPVLPASAHDAHVDISVWRGSSALIDGWTTDMREYPHRCWEQILSRAVAAALAIERGDKSWPDAKAVVQEALDNAGVFQAPSGGMVYFNNSYAMDYRYDDSDVPLTAYTVDAFALLRSLGYAVDETVDQLARVHLANASWDRNDDKASAEALAIAAAIVDLPAEQQAKVVAQAGGKDLTGKVAAARALARTNAPTAGAHIAALLDQATPHGKARSLARGTRWDRWMSSPMREQCELIRLLEDFPQYDPQGARKRLIAGLSDLYAGGVADIDTQSAVACLRALRSDAHVQATSRVSVDASVASQTARIEVAPGETRGAHAFAMPASGAVKLAAVERSEAPVAYLTRVAFEEDARTAERSAMGFSIARAYEVRRKNKWVPITQVTPREGDWIRITLTLRSDAKRYFVAVTDDLPGGLRPVDMELDGVSGANTDREARSGNWPFDETQLDPRKPKFYAQTLPAGEHQIRYYTRVGNTGDYLAAPAVAELMYGEAARARTAAQRIRIQSAGKP